jgi:hypothetical protein
MANFRISAILAIATIFVAQIIQAKSTDPENSNGIDSKNGTIKYVSIIDQCNKEVNNFKQ